MWYVIIDGATLGPYEKGELLSQTGFTPDTLVWREGFAGWTAARDVEELQELFKDKGAQLPEEIEDEEEAKIQGEEVLAAKSEPPYLLIWFIVAALILIYLLTQLYVGR